MSVMDVIGSTDLTRKGADLDNGGICHNTELEVIRRQRPVSSETHVVSESL
jgi:hypothetical protein